MLILDDFYGYHVLARLYKVRHIQMSPHESAFYPPGLFSVQENIRFPIDAVKIQKDSPVLKIFRHLKLIPIPKIGIEE